MGSSIGNTPCNLLGYSSHSLSKHGYKKSVMAVCLGAVITVMTSPAFAKQWQFHDDTTDISFSLDLLGGVTPKGQFKQFDGDVLFDKTKPNDSTLKLTVQTKSLQIDLPESLTILAKNDFFQTKKYPQMTLVSRRVHFYRDDKAKITGMLTLMGRTRPIMMDATIKPMRNDSIVKVDAQTTIKRSDFNVKLPIPGVGDSIPIRLNGFLIPKQ